MHSPTPFALPGQLLARHELRQQPDVYPDRFEFPVRWSDTHDGIVGTLGIAQFYEDTRTKLMRDVIGEDRFSIGRWRSLMRAISIEHLAEAEFGSPLQVAAVIDQVGRSSYGFSLATFQQGRCIALGRAVGVTVSEAKRPEPIPDEPRAALLAHLWPHADATPVTDFNIPQQVDAFRFRQDYRMRFSDTDAVGHLNNVGVVRYHDNALAALQHQLCGRVARRGEAGRWWVARREVSMLGENFYPDVISVALGVRGPIGDTDFTLAQALFQRGSCSGQALTRVCLLDAGGRPQKIDPALRERLAALDMEP
jgi:acyl-CoA thioester hydrolase